MSQHLGDLLASRAALTPDHVAAIGDQQRYSFRELDTRASQWAGYLHQQGLKPGDRIAILCKNSEQVATALFGASRAGVVVALLNWRLQPQELAYILKDCGADTLVYDREFADTVTALAPQVGLSRQLVVDRQRGDDDFEQALASACGELPGHDPDPDQVAVLMYTSGTTGRPKGVMLTHRNLYAAAENCCFTIGWPFQARYLTVTPMFHIAGLMPVFANVLTGSATVYLADFHPVTVWEILEQERITHFLAVPQMLEMMLQAPGIGERDLSSLRFAVSGASAVPAALIARYAELGISIYQVYGATEVAGSASFWMPAMGMDVVASVGHGVMAGGLKIVDPDTGAARPAGQVGEICFGGPQVFAGYWNNPDASRTAIVDGYYHTGDLGYLDDRGFLYVVDRLKDMIISGGENIYPAELEAVLIQHPEIVEVAVVGRADERWGEVPVAFVVRLPGSQLDEAAVIEHCRSQLAAFKSVKAVVFADALPRNASSKLLKHQLKARLETAEPA